MGLTNFKRDTMWVAVLDTIYPRGFNADSMRYIPFGNGAQFEMAIKNDTAKSGAPIFMFEVKAPYDTYPVSYTHLDVYKRQCMNRLKIPVFAALIPT